MLFAGYCPEQAAPGAHFATRPKKKPGGPNYLPPGFISLVGHTARSTEAGAKDRFMAGSECAHYEAGGVVH